METSTTSSPQVSLWRTFYTNFLGEVVGITPENSKGSTLAWVASEMAKLDRAVLLYGEHKFICGILPEVGKAIETSLISGEELILPLPITQSHLEGAFPEFLRDYFPILFFEDRGRIFPRFDRRDIGSAEAVNAAGILFVMRQYFLAFSKVEDIEPEIDLRDEMTSFLNRIQFPRLYGTCNPLTMDSIRNATWLLKELLCDCDESQNGDQARLAAPLAQWAEMPFGCHGPGAVAQGETGKDKWNFESIPGLNPSVFLYYPKVDWIALGYGDGWQPASLERSAERVARACVVPKDFRGHRIICIEPKELQFMQQGLMRVLYKHVHSHFLTKRSIDFEDQVVSMKMARSLRFATIDLKDASDRISLMLARIIFPRAFLKLVTSMRSTHVAWDGVLYKSNILATMGNALCFPLETLTFWSIALGAMIAANRIQLDRSNVRDVLRQFPIRVFGDDVIAPRKWYPFIERVFEDCGFVINRNKTAVDSLVREACGSWWFNATDVRIVRFKSFRLRNTSDWLGYLDASRWFNAIGFSKLSHAICRLAQRMHPVPFGFNGLPGRFVRRYGLTTLPSQRSVERVDEAGLYRWNTELQRLEFRMPSLEGEMVRRDLQGYYGLYAYFTSQATKPSSQGHPCVKWDWREVRL